jgi:PAS domain-containing protein
VNELQVNLICRFSPDGTLTFVNDAFCRFFEKSANGLIGCRLFDLGSDQDRAIMRQRVEALGQLQPDNPSLTTTYQTTSAAGIAVQQHWLYLALFNAQGQMPSFWPSGTT